MSKSKRSTRKPDDVSFEQLAKHIFAELAGGVQAALATQARVSDVEEIRHLAEAAKAVATADEELARRLVDIVRARVGLVPKSAATSPAAA